MENHFNEMKGDVGTLHEKEREQEDAYTKTQSNLYPIPTSLFSNNLHANVFECALFL